MKALKLLLSLTMTLNSMTAFAGPKEDAKVAIEKSHEAAKKWAQTHLRDDLGRILLALIQNPPAELTQGQATLPQQIQQLNERVIAQLDSHSTFDQIDLKQLAQLVEAYRAFVRERFKASFEVQDLIYQRELAIRSFELPFTNFAALCRSGRSGTGSIGDTHAIPRIPNNQYSFNMSYGMPLTGESGMGLPREHGNNATFSFSSAGATEAAKERNTINGALGSAASITTSIAYSGAAGASVSMAMAVMPYMAAAFLAYSVFNYAVSNDEQIAAQNEQAQADTDLFLKSATDRDVAKYYKDICSAAMVKLNPLRKDIRQFALSEENRTTAHKVFDATRAVRAQYLEDAHRTAPSRNTLTLAGYIEGGICDDIKNESICKKTDKSYVLTNFEDTILDLKKDQRASAIDAAKKEIKDFDVKYPQEQVIKYFSYEVFETLYNNWNETSAVIENSSFQAVDRAMNLLANKLQFFVFEAQKASNSPWAKSSKLLGVEQRLQTEFFSLREEYFKLLSEGLKAFFNKANPVEAKARFGQFSKRFEAFSSKTIINPDVRVMNESVRKLGQFYAQL